ncbi:hypothetical protein CKA32_000671 [Geitlerinema sp. FC II]|nr:hypothetical protein CKA32_000671 [Geitlerinema sp. FC II]
MGFSTQSSVALSQIPPPFQSLEGIFGFFNVNSIPLKD